jgi:hypothetical protein
MKYFVILFLFLLSNNTFSQQNRKSYYFNYSSVSEYKIYQNQFNGKLIDFRNTKDSTYYLQIAINGSKKEAIIADYKNKLIIKFDVNFEYQNSNDLKKLSNSKLYTVVNFGKNIKYKKAVEFIEYEKDSITNKTIVHITRFANKKRKKIISELYCFFENMENVSSNHKKSIKNYLIDKHNIILKESENLTKVLCLKEGKIESESHFLEIKSEDVNFEFSIDNVFPKVN